MKLRLLLLTVLIACSFISGCRRHVRTTETGLRTGRVTDRRIANMLETASGEMGCPVGMLQQQEIAQGLYEVVGCNIVRHYSMPCTNRWRCRWSQVAPVEAVVPAAFGCQPPSVYVQATQSPLERVVTACDMQARFVLQCNVSDCGWFMAGPATPMASAPVAPPGGGAPPPPYQSQDAEPVEAPPPIQTTL